MAMRRAGVRPGRESLSLPYWCGGGFVFMHARQRLLL
jgi:hypothetical protein